MDEFNDYQDYQESTKNTSYSVIKFIKPEARFELDKENPERGTFTLKPLERGYGQTIGNALRRVLLASLPGAAIISIEIDGAGSQ